MNRDEAAELYSEYEQIIRMLVDMINHPESWIIGNITR
jgi:hypothetical protein